MLAKVLYWHTLLGYLLRYLGSECIGAECFV